LKQFHLFFFFYILLAILFLSKTKNDDHGLLCKL